LMQKKVSFIKAFLQKNKTKRHLETGVSFFEDSFKILNVMK
jgi:hypothetical protein